MFLAVSLFAACGECCGEANINSQKVSCADIPMGSLQLVGSIKL